MLWVALLLVVVPLVELFFIIQTAQVIGGWPTIGLLLLMGVVGGWLIKREGRSVLRRIDERLRANDLPTRELADGLLLIIAGALMLAPGFIGDALGLLLLFPPTRAVARALLLRRFTAKLGQGFSWVTATSSGGATRVRSGTFVDTTATEDTRSRDARHLGSGRGS